MRNGSLLARHYKTGQSLRITWSEGIIQDITPEPNHDSDLWIVPPIFDLQVNGYGGIDFQQDNLSADHLISAVRQLRAAGCGRFLLTLITDEWPRLTERLKRLRHLRLEHPELRSAIAGWHLEGPFLSAEMGFRGAHRGDLMLDPTEDHIRELRRIAESDLVLLTVAPERSHCIEAISLAVSLGFRISLGHTNSPAPTIAEAIAAGATCFTHLGNACPRELDRHDNILWRILDRPDLMVTLIPDGIHVSPALFRLIHRSHPQRSIAYVTDAMAAAGAPPGRYFLGEMELEVGADQVVRQPGKTNFAGSALRPIDGVFRAAQMLYTTWQDVWDGFSTRPSKFCGIEDLIARDRPANFCVLKIPDGQSVKELELHLND